MKDFIGQVIEATFIKLEYISDIGDWYPVSNYQALSAKKQDTYSSVTHQ